MHENLNKAGRRITSRLPTCMFCLWAVCLSGCMAGAESLTTLIHPGALAHDMNDPAPPIVARLQQPDNPDVKPRPPFEAPPVPPAPPSIPGLVPPSTLQLPSAPSVRGDAILVRAWVNGKPLFDDEFKMTYPQDLLKQLDFAPNDPKTKEMLANIRDKLIDSELMYQDAVNKLESAKTTVLEKLKKEAEKKFDEHMRAIRENFKKTNAGLSEAQFHMKETKFLEDIRDLTWLLRRKAEREFISSEYMRSRVVPKLLTIIGPKEIKEEYESHMNMYVFPGKIKWQDVFIAQDNKDRPTLAATKRYAEDLLTRYRNDFKSILPYNQGDSRHRGGDGIGTHPSYKLGDKIIPTDIRPIEMETHLAKLREGESMIVETSTGVHIIRLVKFEPSKQRAFTQEVQMEIRNRLRGEVFEREVKYLIRELRTRADIMIVAD